MVGVQALTLLGWIQRCMMADPVLRAQLPHTLGYVMISHEHQKIFLFLSYDAFKLAFLG